MSTSTTTTTKGNGNPQACAACKYQRRKCAPDCILAPYFPHDSQRQFLNAHKLFGVSNITKIIKNLDPHERCEAMRTIKIQSDVRANDPVGGCYRLILELKRQIEYNKAELDIVLHQLAICRAQAHHQVPQQNHHHEANAHFSPVGHVEHHDDQNPSLINCDIINNVEALSFYNPMHYYHYIQGMVHEQQYDFNNIDNNNIQHHHHHLVQEDVNTWVYTGCDDTTLDSSLHINEENDNGSINNANQSMTCERKEHKFDQHQEMVERQFAPSTPLLMSS